MHTVPDEYLVHQQSPPGGFDYLAKSVGPLEILLGTSIMPAVLARDQAQVQSGYEDQAKAIGPWYPLFGP